MAKKIDCEFEYRPLTDRRFRVDVALPALKLIFECDGWQYHTKLHSWKREKERDRLITLAGWKIYRFAASEILSGSYWQTVEQAINKELERENQELE